MINFSLEKFRSSDATETFRVKNSDNILTKSRKVETKSSWIIKLRSFFKFEEAKNQGSRISTSHNLIIIYIPISLHLCLATMTCVHSLSYETHGRSGAPNGRGPGSLNLLNLPLLRHCLCPCTGYTLSTKHKVSAILSCFLPKVTKFM